MALDNNLLSAVFTASILFCSVMQLSTCFSQVLWLSEKNRVEGDSALQPGEAIHGTVRYRRMVENPRDYQISVSWSIGVSQEQPQEQLQGQQQGDNKGENGEKWRKAKE